MACRRQFTAIACHQDVLSRRIQRANHNGLLHWFTEMACHSGSQDIVCGNGSPEMAFHGSPSRCLAATAHRISSPSRGLAMTACCHYGSPEMALRKGSLSTCLAATAHRISSPSRGLAMIACYHYSSPAQIVTKSTTQMFWGPALSSHEKLICW